MKRLLDDTLSRAVRQDRLDVTDPDGETRSHGPGGRRVAVALHDPSLPRRILLDADLAMGEACMDGRMTIRDDDLRGFMAIADRARTNARDVPALRFHQGVSELGPAPQGRASPRKNQVPRPSAKSTTPAAACSATASGNEPRTRWAWAKASPPAKVSRATTQER